MPQFDYDLFVVGAGSGGVRAARVAAGHGAKAAIAEESRVGGTCVIRGCVPKKLLSYAAHFHEDFEDAQGFGWSLGSAKFDWPTLIANKDVEIDRLNGIYKKLLSGSGVGLLESRAVLQDPHTLDVGGKKVTAKNILISVGGWPEMPDVLGVDLAISSNEAFHLATLPRSVVVVGGGYIALEFAGIFNGLGAETHLLYRGEQILRGFDDDVRNFSASEIIKKGVKLRTQADVVKIEAVEGRRRVTLKDGHTIVCDAVMYATGRAPKTDGMGLEAAGVALAADKSVKVDAFSKTSVDNIHAVGDCTNRANLTPVAIKEGHAYADTVFGNKSWCVDHTNNSNNGDAALTKQHFFFVNSVAEKDRDAVCVADRNRFDGGLQRREIAAPIRGYDHIRNMSFRSTRRRNGNQAHAHESKYA